MYGAFMDWFQLLLDKPIENIPAWILVAMSFVQLSKMILNLVTSAQTNNTRLQAGNQAIIAQDNGLQSKILDEMTARRISDESFRSRLADLLDEKVSRIDGTTTRIDGTTIATSAEVKAIIAHLQKLDKALLLMYRKIEKKEAA